MKKAVCAVLVVLSPASLAQLTPLDATVVELSEEVSPFRRLADFDGDGDPDAVGIQIRDDDAYYRIHAYENFGDGRFFETFQSYSVRGGGRGKQYFIEVDDLDGDGLLDIGVLAAGSFHPWISQGDGTFVKSGGLDLGTAARAFLLADLDLDGSADVVWATGNLMKVRLASSPNVLTIDHTLTGFKTMRLILDDGPLGEDVFVLAGGADVQLIYGSTSSGLVLGPRFSPGTSHTGMFDAGDVDMDGDLDVVLFGMSDYRVLRRDTPGAWTLESVQVGGPATFLADVDLDGDPDGVCCGGGGGPYPSYQPNVTPTNFEISINDGTGGFAPAFQIPGLGSPELAGAVDVDMDGDIDLVAGRCVYFSFDSSGPKPPPSTDPPPFRGPRDLCDFDGDGDVDIGFSLDGVHVNDGTGTFSWQPVGRPESPQGTRFVGPGFPGDFDGDGDVDLIVEQRPRGAKLRAFAQPPAQHRQMVLLSNDGDGVLEYGGPASELDTSFALQDLEPHNSLVHDIDGDGDLDLVALTTASTSDPGSSQIWINDGTGYFTPDLGLSGRLAGAGDFTGDGVVDLLVLIPNAIQGWFPRLQPMIGVPNGASPPSFVATGEVCSWAVLPDGMGLSIGDFNGDGAADATYLVGAWEGSLSTITMYDEFGLPTCSASGSPGYESCHGFDAHVAVGDLDGNGTFDGVSGPVNLIDTRTVSEISLAKPLQVPGGFVGYQPRILQLMEHGLLADIDGDGDLDVIGQGSITLNRSTD